MASRLLPRTLLEQLIRDSDHTINEWCQLFNATGEQLRTKVTLSARQLQRWMAGEVDGARPAARRVAAVLWGQDFTALLAPPPGGVAAPLRETAGNPSHGAAGRHTATPAPDVSEAVTIMAAYESSRHAAEVGGGVSPVSIEHIQAEVFDLARGYADLPPLTMLAQARRARNLTYQVLDRTRRPAQTADLYLAAGQLCGLMAVASFDLAVWSAAAEQARAAQVYAELVGHAGLRSWAQGTLALISNWTGRPRQALVHIDAGLDQAPAGTAQARLRCIEARSWSQLGGDPTRVTTALRAADEALAASDSHDDLHDEIGGEYGWGPGRHASCAGTALLTVGEISGAIQRATTAIELLPEDPSGGLVAERSHIDLAAAELALGSLDAAVAALDPIWRVAVPQRRHSITGRLDDVARALSKQRWYHEHTAVELRDRIETFNTEAEGRALTSG